MLKPYRALQWAEAQTCRLAASLLLAVGSEQRLALLQLFLARIGPATIQNLSPDADPREQCPECSGKWAHASFPSVQPANLEVPRSNPHPSHKRISGSSAVRVEGAVGNLLVDQLWSA